MNHHTGESKCPLCEEKLGTCDKAWLPIYYAIKSEFPDCHISCGGRGESEQNLLFRQRKSMRQWPHSMHNVMIDGKMRSKAVDLFRILDDGSAEFENSYYLLIAAFLNKLDAKVEWAGDWRKFKEYCHFQLEE